jgi:methylamine dehydrogenase heavy chain
MWAKIGHGLAVKALAAGVTACALALPAPAISQEEPREEKLLEDLPPLAVSPVEEEVEILKAPAPDARRVYVIDQADFHVINKVFAIDGNDNNGDGPRVLGMMDTGKLPNLVIPQAHNELYVFDSLFRRIARGEREDFISIYDPETLSVTEEVDVPEGRLLVMTKLNNAALTPGDRYLLHYNFTPVPSVTITDIQERNVLGQFEISGCFLMYPMAERRFAMVCRDGSLLVAEFDEQGQVQTQQTEPFFPEDEFIFDHPAFSRPTGQAFFVSYQGNVFPADLSGDTPQFQESWSLLTDEEREQHWRVGGWQIAAFHPGTNRLYVLMDIGEEWTHKDESGEIWVYDVEQRERVDRLKLFLPALSIAVSRDEEPRLFALSAEEATLHIFDAQTGRFMGQVDELGFAPHVVMVGEVPQGEGR